MQYSGACLVYFHPPILWEVYLLIFYKPTAVVWKSSQNSTMFPSSSRYFNSTCTESVLGLFVHIWMHFSHWIEVWQWKFEFDFSANFNTLSALETCLQMVKVAVSNMSVRVHSSSVLFACLFFIDSFWTRTRQGRAFATAEVQSEILMILIGNVLQATSDSVYYVYFK